LLNHRQLALKEFEINDFPRLRFLASQMLLNFSFESFLSAPHYEIATREQGIRIVIIFIVRKRKRGRPPFRRESNRKRAFLSSGPPKGVQSATHATY
jgi:hypothetical protein